MSTADEALERLRAGNRRFVTGEGVREIDASPARRRAIAEGQAPFAIVLGCSDSRVPAELVFDQGLGDLFVIRVAGNIVAPSQIGSIEFAAERFGTRLVVVMGHSDCGAITATLEALQGGEATPSPNLRSIVDRIRPAVEGLVVTGDPEDPAALVPRAVRANVEASVRRLRHGSEVLESLIRDDGLRIVGSEYALSTGEVHFLDDV
jgi:carbonic anhydrase